MENLAVIWSSMWWQHHLKSCLVKRYDNLQASLQKYKYITAVCVHKTMSIFLFFSTKKSTVESVIPFHLFRSVATENEVTIDSRTLSHTQPLLPSPLSLLIYLFLLFVVCKTLRAVLLMFSSMSGPWYKNMPIVVRISPTVPSTPSPSLLSFSLHLSLSLFCPQQLPFLCLPHALFPLLYFMSRDVRGCEFNIDFLKYFYCNMSSRIRSCDERRGQSDGFARNVVFSYLAPYPATCFIYKNDWMQGGGGGGPDSLRRLSPHLQLSVSLLGGCVCVCIFWFSKPKCILEMYHWLQCKQTDETMNWIRPQRFKAEGTGEKLWIIYSLQMVCSSLLLLHFYF